MFISRIGQQVFDRNPEYLDKTVSVILMTTLSKPNDQIPLEFEMIHGTNDAISIRNFIVNRINNGTLRRGDILFVK